MTFEVSSGEPRPLGASWDGQGVNFALRSGSATRVELCLFDPSAPSVELARVELPAHTGDVFHGRVAGLAPGMLYGYRVHGPWDPERGQRHNPHKLLVDPYARALFGEVVWNEATRGSGKTERADLALDTRDSGPFVPRGVIIDSAFDWEGDQPPATEWSDTLLYEAHVRGFTKQHPAIRDELRGSYAALAEPAAIAHMKQLGVTALELLPIHEPLDDSFLVDRGLSNYWGYSTLGFFAPAHRYASTREPGAVVNELKRTIKALHRAGIEVILDVVYNHSCEGDHGGPTLSLKGVDNAGYYALAPDASRYLDVTGCGNSIDASKPLAADLIFDSLRYWVEELHVDGFRFDLATTLGRDATGHYDSAAPLWRRIQEDPLFSHVKLIAEPWDLGVHGYRVGDFPAPFREWNDKYRDFSRRLWRGADVRTSELADRLFGSPDVYAARSPFTSINFVTAHDGFTLRDLVSYQQKYNLGNGEHNRDGSDQNESVNHGIEGETSDPVVLHARLRHQKNLLATLLLSQGVPMLLAGDELGRTQGGNNNAYCQDNAISWLSFQIDDTQRELLALTQRLVALRRQHHELRPPHFLRGTTAQAPELLRFAHADGSDLSEEDWSKLAPQTFMVLLAPELGTRATLALLFHRGAQETELALPGSDWQVVLATDGAPQVDGSRIHVAGESLVVCSRELNR